MSFISPEFIFFFTVVFFVYFAAVPRYRWLFLLIVSIFFYAVTNAVYFLILLVSTFSTYLSAQLMIRTNFENRRKQLLILAILTNGVILFFFKYLSAFTPMLAQLFHLIGIPFNLDAESIALPLGVSFYTFSAISYAIDVYQGKIEPENHPGIFATFMLFFPKLVAGPIERAKHLLPQLHQRRDFDDRAAVYGLRLILWGFFKKLVIADRLNVYVSTVYGNPHQYTGLVLILATLFFAFQVYCDFSGYSDIAVGAARMLGIQLVENFKQPFFATSMRDLWRRWHISLSTWIRDYIFYPVALNLSRWSNGRYPRSVEIVTYMIMMVCVGLWHGATSTFIAWGIIQGVLIGAEVWLISKRISIFSWLGVPSSVSSMIKIVLIFCLFCFSLIFFRANALSDAMYIAQHLFTFRSFQGLSTPFTHVKDSQLELILSVGLVVFLLMVDFVEAKWRVNTVLDQIPTIVRWGIYYGLAAIVFTAFVNSSEVQSFIYFKF